MSLHLRFIVCYVYVPLLVRLPTYCAFMISFSSQTLASYLHIYL